VLASGSASRRLLLENAGVAVDVEAAAIDERRLEDEFLAAGGSPAQLAARLARAKAVKVSARRPGALCIGADQTLRLDGELLHKSADMAGAETTLCRLAGRTHVLTSAVCVVRDGASLFEMSQDARLTMRALDRGAVRRYLAAAGPAVLSSVGAYQVEGVGIHLFEAIDGDHWTILGLPLPGLLKWLRANGFIAL
jgi:septum formation protein